MTQNEVKRIVFLISALKIVIENTISFLDGENRYVRQDIKFNLPMLLIQVMLIFIMQKLMPPIFTFRLASDFILTW